MRPVYYSFIGLTVVALIGSGCAKQNSTTAMEVPSSTSPTVATTVRNQDKASFSYRDLFMRDAKPDWVTIYPDHFSISVPYSQDWRVSDVSLSQYQTDSSTEEIKNIRFGRPTDGGTYVIREYFIYRTPKIKLDFSSQETSPVPLEDILSCVDGFKARLTKVGNIEGIEHHIGGAKGCSTGFAFNVGAHTYYLYHVPDLGEPPTGITDEMKGIIESVRE